MSLESLKNDIESMPKYHQIEVLNIFKQYKNVCINENNNGTFINLTELDDDVIDVLRKYTGYVNEQKSTLDAIEKEKERIEKVYFNNNDSTQ